MPKHRKSQTFMETIEATYYLIRIGARGSIGADHYCARSTHRDKPRLYRLLTDPQLEVSEVRSEDQVRRIRRNPSVMRHIHYALCLDRRIRRGTIIDWHFEKYPEQ